MENHAPLATQVYFENLPCEQIPDLVQHQLNGSSDPTIVMMSTTAHRLFKKTDMILEAILSISTKQTVVPDAFLLVLPEYSIVDKEMYRIPGCIKPEWLLKSCRDYGPATKFIPGIKTFAPYYPSARLISIDDDMHYDPKTIEIFLRYDKEPASVHWNQSPGSAIITAWIDYPGTKSSKTKEPKQGKAPLGVYGYMYQPQFFDPDHLVWPTALKKAFYREDDMWFACLAKSLEKKIFVVPGLKHKMIVNCPLKECLHSKLDDKAARAHLNIRDTCDSGAHLKWEDEYFE